MMYAFKRILVALDLSELDATLTAHAAAMARLLGAEHVFFFHVSPNEDEVPMAVREAFPELGTTSHDTASAAMEEGVKRHFANVPSCQTHVEVMDGEPTKQLLHYADEHRVDLIIMGRKKTLKGQGITVGRVIRLANCSILLVPEGQEVKPYKKILVPTDFSNHSEMAMVAGLGLAQTFNSCTLIAHNVYKVPTGYSSAGKSYEEFAAIMETHAMKDFERFRNKIDAGSTPVEAAFSLDNDTKPADKILEKAQELGVDLIITGSKGRTGAASILLGSNAERLVNLNNEFPQLVVKKKNENLNFLQALLRL